MTEPRDHLQRVVVPIGRHSLIHGLGAAGSDVDIPGEIARFTAEASTLFAAQDALGAWARRRVAHNLDVIGRAGDDVALDDYADAVVEDGLTPDAGFFAYLESLQ